MPPVNLPPNLHQLFAEINRRLSALEGQQNWGITDSNLTKRIFSGLQPDASYAIWIYDTSNNVHVKIGQLASGWGLSSGDGSVVLNETELSVGGGAVVLDASGVSAGSGAVVLNSSGLLVKNGATTEAQAGLIGSQYGFAVLDPTSGHMFMVQPPQEASVAGTLSTTSTTYTNLSGPSVTVTVGAAGQALVMPSCTIGIDGGAAQASYWQGLVGVSVDGGAATGLLGVSSGLISTGDVAPLQLTSSNSIMWTGLSAGSHTFKMLYKSTNGQNIHFSTNSLVVTAY